MNTLILRPKLRFREREREMMWEFGTDLQVNNSI